MSNLNKYYRINSSTLAKYDRGGECSNFLEINSIQAEMPVASSGGGHFCAVPAYPDKNLLTTNKMKKQFLDNGN
ncbi:MAG: hypothetical protein K2G18_03220, partial [Bacteroidales bacterium]|nr:hypothetical protein [Bacteroidales bacterium]